MYILSSSDKGQIPKAWEEPAGLCLGVVGELGG